MRFERALGVIREALEAQSSQDLRAFDGAAARVREALDGLGRVLPHEGWLGLANADGLFHTEGLPFAPPDLVRWRQGIHVAPYVRALKSSRPVVMAVLDGWNARLLEYRDGEMTRVHDLTGDRWSVEASDVRGSKRGTSTTGRRGETRTDYARKMLDAESRRFRNEVIEHIVRMAGHTAGVAICGTPKATAAVRKELEEVLPGRIVEISDPSFDSTEAELAAAAAVAASELTRDRQARLLESCAETPDRGSLGWNRTYRALMAGAVDTLLVARPLIERSPDDAERLVRLALAQGADVEELGDDIGGRLWENGEGVAARLRFRMVA